MPSAPLSRALPLTVALVLSMQMLDGTIIATALPVMAGEFGVDAVTMGTGISVYLLSLAAVMPAAAWAGERWGARRVLVASVALFTLASLLCAAAPNLEAFLAARVLQGAAAALLAPVGRTLVLAHAPKDRLIEAIALITWPALLAPVLGPVIGAALTETVGWRWCFLVNLPVGAVAIPLLLWLTPRGRPSDPPPLDMAGLALCSSALILLLGGLEAVSHGWRPALGLTVAALGVVLATLALRHLGRAARPLLDPSVLRVRSFRMATVEAGTVGRVAVNATPYLLPLLFQVGLKLPPLQSGRLVLVYFAGNLAMKSVTTWTLRRWGFRRVLVVNGVLVGLTMAAVGLAAQPHAGTVAPLLWGLLVAAGLTRSLQYTALNTLAFADVAEAARGTSSVLASMSQQVAMVLGVVGASALVRGSEALRGAAATGLWDLRLALLLMAGLALLSGLLFLRLPPGTGREVTGVAS